MALARDGGALHEIIGKRGSRMRLQQPCRQTEAAGIAGGRVPKISVVVPTFNVERFVSECLASVTMQSLADWECIVVDDGSTDGTRERIRKRSDARIQLVLQSNKGVSAARN